VRLGLSAAVGVCDAVADFLSVKTSSGAGGAGDGAGGAGSAGVGGRAPFLAVEWSVDTRAGGSAGPLAGGEALALLEGRGGWWRALGARAAARVRVGGAEVAGNAAGLLPLLSQLARAGCVPAVHSGPPRGGGSGGAEAAVEGLVRRAEERIKEASGTIRQLRCAPRRGHRPLSTEGGTRRVQLVRKEGRDVSS
jgi:hypothetical protein